MQAFKIIKNGTTTLFVVLLTIQLYGQVKGDGNVIKQERNVPAFTGIEVQSGIDLFITQGTKQSVIIEAEENLQDLITTEVTGPTLQVYVKKGTNIWRSQGMKAYITVTDLKSVSVSGGGDVASQSLIKTGDIEINISGGGDLKFDLEAGRTSCTLSGGGDAHISGTASDCKLTISGGGDLELKAGLRSLDATVSGGGDVTIATEEKSDKIEITVSGGGDLNLKVNATDMKTYVSGGGDADISAGMNVGNAEVAVSGGGDLQMALEAENVKLTIGGGGDAKLTGTANKFDATVSSGSDLDADGLKAVDAKVSLTGGSDANLNVTGTLEISASGGGQVYLTGKPQIKNASLSGGSEIHNQ